MKVCFDEAGITVSHEKKQEIISYDKVIGIFETEHLWLVVYDKRMSLLLQKKDLIERTAEEFYLHLTKKILQNTKIFH